MGPGRERSELANELRVGFDLAVVVQTSLLLGRGWRDHHGVSGMVRGFMI